MSRWEKGSSTQLLVDTHIDVQNICARFYEKLGGSYEMSALKGKGQFYFLYYIHNDLLHLHAKIGYVSSYNAERAWRYSQVEVRTKEDELG